VIYLSWIQNFFERFVKEEDAKQQEIHTNTQQIPNKIQQPGNKDLDARIAYQYPKGHFRFPVIPDEHKPRRHTAEHIDKKNRGQDRHHESYKKQLQQEPAKVQKTEGVKIHSSGPFRPTEIPSPVFGFNRPQKMAVEYELTQFETGIYKRPKGTEIKTSESDKESVSASALFAQEEDTRWKQQTIHDIENHHAPELNIEIEEKESIQNISLPNQLVENENDEDVQSPDLLLKSESDRNILEESKAEAEIDAALVEVAAANGVSEHPVEYFDGNDQEEEIDSIEVPADVIEVEPKNGMDEENVVPLEMEKPKKKHLPFNVIMLKQDKQKWEEKKRRQMLEQNRFRQPIVSEPAIVSEPVIVSEPAIVSEPVIVSEQASVPEPAVVPEPAAVSEPIDKEAFNEEGPYEFPTFELLNPPVVEDVDADWLEEQENLLNQTLENFNVGAKVVNITQGPSVTRFEVQPEPGVKVNKVTNLTDDIKLSLAARDIRMEAPIPGKHTIGIEVPNQKSRPVQISEIIQSSVFNDSVSPLTAALGLDISGKPIVTDLKKMPHGLIAGATGSGKSVCINSILVSLLYKASPEDLKLLLIDPKMVELAPYNRIPHLVSPVITDVKAATASLKWAVEEMERRYELFAHTGVRDINRFNELAIQHKRYSDKLPFIVIVIDELADLMMMSPADVEEAICRIAQKARACGIHLIVATQRPSVDVITGLIKANIPTRIAFSVSSQVDSRTIIDIGGAEKLLGRGDMLFLENGSSKPVRLQGTFVSDDEIDFVVAHVREQQEPDYLFEQEELLKKAQASEEEDELFYEACEFVVDQSSASTSSLQRRFKIGYNRAARLMEMMERQGYISSSKGSKPREVFITSADLENIQETGIQE
jgi:S-DNA-T family DNA segregation ATPase FtsK/SpoIIIE